MMLLVLPVSASSQAVTTQQRDEIERELKDENANTTVLVGDSAHPTVISNRVDTSDRHTKLISTDKLFPIASLEKGITGVALQQQYDQGKLSPESKLSQYLPQVTNSHQITLNDLATHTSGLADARTIAQAPIKTTKGNVAFTEHNYRVVNNQPGTWFYANVNYGLLAMVISQVNHQSYHHYLENQLIRANHIHGMRFFEQLNNDRDVTPSLVKPSFARDASETNEWRYLQREMSAEYGAGQILATPLAYWQFINRALLGQAQIRNAYLNASRQIHGNPAYYNGFYLTPGELHANGFTDGYTCTVYINLINRRSLIVFGNNISLQKCRAVASQVNKIYVGA